MCLFGEFAVTPVWAGSGQKSARLDQSKVCEAREILSPYSASTKSALEHVRAISGPKIVRIENPDILTAQRSQDVPDSRRGHAVSALPDGTLFRRFSVSV